MGSIFQTTLNTRALPNLMEFLKAYVEEHLEVDINIIIPSENNIKRVLEAL